MINDYVIWIAIVVAGVMVVLNIILLATSLRKKEEVPDTLPKLSVQPEPTLKERLDKDIETKKARLELIKSKAKELEQEYSALKTSVRELETMRGDML